MLKYYKEFIFKMRSKTHRKISSFSVGIMAYNEEKNISKLLDQLLGQTVKKFIHEIIVVSSGSSDKTNQIVRNFSRKDKRIKLIIKKKREGKAKAVNTFLSKAKKDILVLISADVLLNRDSLENLLSPFENPNVGITGSHPIPVNDPKTFTGFAAHLLWKFHHQISLDKPKMGEMIAFKKIFKQIPAISAVDEANIEPLIRGQGYEAIYAPNAIVYNKGPETIREFITSRRRIYFGHLSAKKDYSYEVSTFNPFGIFLLIPKNIQPSWRFFFWTPLVVSLEAYSRFLGYLDYKSRTKKHTVWEIIPSTKQVIRNP